MDEKIKIRIVTFLTTLMVYALSMLKDVVKLHSSWVFSIVFVIAVGVILTLIYEKLLITEDKPVKLKKIEVDKDKKD